MTRIDRPMSHRTVRITHRPSGDLIAEGPVGWGITPFDGGWYIAGQHLRVEGFRRSPLPGLCPYKGVYLVTHYRARDGSMSRGLAWSYVVPNPLLPFIAFRVAVPKHHPDLEIEVFDRSDAGTGT